MQAAIGTTAMRHAAGALGRTRRLAAGNMSGGYAPLAFQVALAAGWANRLLVAAHEFLKLQSATLAGVFVNRHGIRFPTRNSIVLDRSWKIGDIHIILRPGAGARIGMVLRG